MEQAPTADAAPALPAELAGKTVISVDAMGGDEGPAAIVGGLAKSAHKNPDIGFIVHGRESELAPLIAKRQLEDRCVIRHTDDVVTMNEKPSTVMRQGQGSSMWSAIESVRNGEATVAVSCGNTGALMLLSMVRLKKLAGVKRPAIACLWPSRAASGFSVMLDVGADIKADEDDLLQFALMGASYARNGLGISKPRVGILNLGTEKHKGRSELKAAHFLIAEVAPHADLEFVGFVEGGDIPSGDVDVIVTDGFTGNIALKTAEGTATLIRDFLRDAFKRNIFTQVAGLLAYTSLRRLSKRIDPRQVNGGVFLGLNGTIVKSHGSADATGVSAAIKLAFQLAQAGFNERVAARIASASEVRRAAEESATARSEDSDPSVNDANSDD